MKPRSPFTSRPSKPPGSAVAASPPTAVGAVVFAGMAYVCLGWAFSYLDRRFSHFGLETLLWLGWGALGFGAGALHLRHGSPAGGQRQWKTMAVIGFALSLFPGLALYAFPRWVSVALMVVVGARAATLRTERDLHLTLTVLFAVSFTVATHAYADWSLWFYLGPAWWLAALALAWNHARGSALATRVKLGLTSAFAVVVLLCSVVAFVLVPRPPFLGWGFLPGGDAAGSWGSPALDGGGPPARSGTSPGVGGAGQGGQGGQVAQARPAPQGTLERQWRGMLADMRASAKDPFMPQWQRSLIEGMARLGESLLNALAGGGRAGEGAQGGTNSGAGTGQTGGAGSSSDATPPPAPTGLPLPWWLLVAAALWLLYRWRHRAGLAVALGASWGLARWYPLLSMRLTAQAMTWCLQSQGVSRPPGQSLREHWLSAPGLPDTARHWMQRALAHYGAVRFGGRAATANGALNMRRDVQGAADIALQVLPAYRRSARHAARRLSSTVTH